MARTAQAGKAKNLPAKAGAGDLPAIAEDFFDGADGFAGVDSGDVALPRFTILQALSTQVNKRHTDYVKGAEPGMIINSATGELFTELPIIVGAYQRRHVEWIPRSRGGGLVKDHGLDEGPLLACVQSEDDGSYWTGDKVNEGNQMVVTGTWYVINPETMATGFIAMGNTHFTSSRKIMAAMRDLKVHTKEGFIPAPLFAKVWVLSARERSNEKGTWFTWKAMPREWAYNLPTAPQVVGAVRAIQQQLEQEVVLVDMSVDEEPVGEDTAEGAAM